LFDHRLIRAVFPGVLGVSDLLQKNTVNFQGFVNPAELVYNQVDGAFVAGQVNPDTIRSRIPGQTL